MSAHNPVALPHPQRTQQATVDREGVVRGVAPGTAIITASIAGKTASVTVK
ncbi:hypothetical protein ACFP81_01215 [Deinococcus lacus]|uniref:BIG2 domain-containing protein n=1 Tax=Deinococcus lacus TaxID=392561 RepID=A0ABW1Y9I5_9DEIO